MKSLRLAGGTAVVVAALLVAGCTENSNPLKPTPSANEYSADLAIAWMDLATDLVKAERWSPPAASRLFGFAGVTLYEAVVKGVPGNRSLVGQLNELDALPEFGDESYHWPTVANAAVATVMRSLFASGSAASLDAIADMENSHYTVPTSSAETEIYKRSMDQGKLLGLAIFGWALNDGSPQFNNCSFTPPSGAGNWIPTPPAFASALQPCWGNLRTFALTSGAECMPGPPPTFSETEGTPFYSEMMEVYTVCQNLTPEQLTIAGYWADNPGETATPPGHSISIAGQVLAEQDKKLGFAAEAYARVGIAIADAFIGCWKTKYEYNLIRPVSCIRSLVQADWLSPVATPPFPEYTSGHSVQSGAAAQVLTDLFGEHYSFVDHTHDDLGMTARNFSSFFDFADEAAISRLYGGIHFRSAIEIGVEQGKCIGEKVDALQFKD